MIIAVQGNKEHAEIIAKYFNDEDRYYWNYNTPSLCYYKKGKIIISEWMTRITDDFKVLTYKDLEEL